MTGHFADALTLAIREKRTAACVGLDPDPARLPREIRERGVEPPQMLGVFCDEVLRIVAPLVPVVKINSAFFEAYHAAGVECYDRCVQAARRLGLLVIGDVKRADIGSTSDFYAAAHLGVRTQQAGGEHPTPDAITINPYFGRDGVQPFFETADALGKGVFVLVQTSNKSASEVQGLVLQDGSTVSERVARLVDQWGSAPGRVGTGGYSLVGAVVSPGSDEASTRRLRELMPRAIFLVPGFGAQGRTAHDVRPCFRDDGTGAIVNASRSVLYAYEEPAYRDRFGDDWRRCIEHACRDFIAALGEVVRTP